MKRLSSCHKSNPNKINWHEVHVSDFLFINDLKNCILSYAESVERFDIAEIREAVLPEAFRDANGLMLFDSAIYELLEKSIILRCRCSSLCEKNVKGTSGCDCEKHYCCNPLVQLKKEVAKKI